MTLTPIRQSFLVAADAAARLLSDPAVAARWDEPSALAEFSVSGLAGHLALQLQYIRDVLAAPAPNTSPSTLEEHYNAAAWITAAIDDQANVSVRDNGAEAAQGGPLELAATARATAAALPDALLMALPDRLILVVWANRTLLLDDFVLTRLMEIVVHSDDLAVSVGVPTPVLAKEVLEPAVLLLTQLAVRRHGGLPLLRALSRQERAPETIAAF